MGNVSNAVIQFLASSKTRVAILGLLVLSTGVFTTIYLVGQQQDIRQRAAESTCDPNLCYAATSGSTCAAVGPCCTTQGIRPDGTVGCAEDPNWNNDGQQSGGDGGGTSSDNNNPVQSDNGTGGTGGNDTSFSYNSNEFQRGRGGSDQTTCSTCLEQGKSYLCPGIGGFSSGSCSNNSYYGFCTKCEEPTPTPGSCNQETGRELNCACTSPAECASGNCGAPAESINNSRVCLPPGTPTPTTGNATPTPTNGVGASPTPSLSPAPTGDPACILSTNKPDGCTCSINAHCASGFCNASGICQNPNQVLTCDPNNDGVIDISDFQVWRNEYTGDETTTLADCFSPNGVVDLEDFQVWREIYITHERQPF